jgi:hypothetical protein
MLLFLYSLNRPESFILVCYLVIVPATDEIPIYGCQRQWMSSICLCLAAVSMLDLHGWGCDKDTSYTSR